MCFSPPPPPSPPLPPPPPLVHHHYLLLLFHHHHHLLLLLLLLLVLQEFLSHKWVIEHCTIISRVVAEFGFVLASISHSADTTLRQCLPMTVESPSFTDLCTPALPCSVCVELFERLRDEGMIHVAWQGGGDLEDCIKELSAHCNPCLVCSKRGIQQTASPHPPFLPTPLPSPLLTFSTPRVQQIVPNKSGPLTAA